MKKRISVLLAVLLLLSALPVFADTTSKVSEVDRKTLLSALEIMSGDPDGNFRTQDPISRAEFAKVAVCASTYKDLVAFNAPVSPFSDVPYTHWAAPYILQAVNGDVVKGYTDATFRPEGTVTCGEAVTMLLKLLGYTDGDFGLAWPYGQMAVARSIGLLDGVSAAAEESLNRGEAMTLLYQLLRTPQKNGGADYIETLGYTYVEDVVLIATAAEEISVGAGKILTTSGTYRIGADYDSAFTGRRGDLVLKNRDTVKVFLPDSQQVEVYSVNQVLSDDVMVLKNGTLSALGLGKGLTVYHEGKGTALSALLSTLSVGDVLTLYKDENGTPDYATVSTEMLVGPITVNGPSWQNEIGLSSPEVMKNGQRVTPADITINDILYYSKALNRVFAYRKQVNGIYEKALPNRDQPTQVVVSGITYAIEGANALDALASGGNVNLGESVTLLLGKSGAVADVVRLRDSVVGYLTVTGTKSYEKDASMGTFTGYYATIILPDGEECQYITQKDYDNLRNQVVTVRFENDGIATLSRYRQEGDYSGLVSASKNRIGGKTIAADAEILDVSTTESNKTGLATSVYLSRLDGITISENAVLYAKTDDRGQITQLILKNQTGDMFDYVLVTEAEESADNMIVGRYTYLHNGASQTVSSNNTLFGIKGRSGARLTLSSNGMVEGLSPLTRLSETVTSLTAATLVVGEKEYPISDRVTVYRKSDRFEYHKIPLDTLTADSGQITAYYDSLPSKGGRIRIIVVE